MSTLSSQALWRKLQEHGLVSGEMPPVAKADSPWYVRVMLGSAGWIGSLFLLGFVAVGFAFVMNSATASLLVGVLLSGGALALFKASRERDFLTQFGLATALAGQMLLIYGLAEHFSHHGVSFYGALFVIEALLTLLVPNFIYRVMTTLAAAIALVAALDSAGCHGLAIGVTAAAFVLVWMQDLRWGRFAALCRPAGYGLALALLVIQTGSLSGMGAWWLSTPQARSWLAIQAPWLGKALVVAVFLVVVAVLLKRLNIAAASRAGLTVLTAAGLIMAVSFAAPGFATAMLILVVGFAGCNRMLLGLGLLACGAFLTHYYYLMESTLLFKSLLLVGLGGVLLVSRLVLLKGVWATRQEDADA